MYHNNQKQNITLLYLLVVASSVLRLAGRVIDDRRRSSRHLCFAFTCQEPHDPTTTLPSCTGAPRAIRLLVLPCEMRPLYMYMYVQSNMFIWRTRWQSPAVAAMQLRRPAPAASSGRARSSSVDARGEGMLAKGPLDSEDRGPVGGGRRWAAAGGRRRWAAATAARPHAPAPPGVRVRSS